MAATRRAFVAAAWSALALVRSEPLPTAASPERRNRKGGVTTNRNLASCESVEVTGGYGYTPGVYDEDGSRNGVEAYLSSDGSSRLFYSDREETDDDNRRRRLLLLPEDLFDDVVHEEEEGEEEGREGVERGAMDRRLGACLRGFWSLAPAGDGYPRLRVSDCAQHPADIKVSTWTQVTCATCAEQTYSGNMPKVECFVAGAPSPSPPSPSESSPTKSPTIATSVGDDDASAGGSDGSVEDSSSSGAPVDGSCKVLDVGGRYAGLYTVVGSYNGRGDYYSENQEHNIFFELDSSSTSSAGASDQGDDDDDGSDDDGNRRMLLDEVITAHRARGGREGGRGLAACDSGYWIKTPTGGGYPFFALADCAVYPENIATTSSWLIITCDGCDAGPATSTQAIACATGEDAFVATPSPVPPVANAGSNVDTLPGTGITTCEEVTVTGVRGGGYTVVGEVNNRADVYSDDGEYRLFFTGPAPALATNGGRTRRLVSGEEYRDVPFVPFAAEEVGRSRALQEECEGYWYIIPADGKYPTYAVFDCAFHPADIVNTDWLYLECEDCAVVTASPKPAVKCTGAPDNVKRGGSWVTPSPAGVLAPGGVTPSPAASAFSTCETLVITGDYPGNFTSNGTYRGKLDFFNEDVTVNLYFELATSSRRALKAEGQERRVFPGDAMESALTDSAAVATRSLAVCTSGYWIMAPVGGNGYPVFAVPDCAEHPADIRANTWLIASCETCGVQDAPSFVAPTIVCADSVGAASDVGGATPTPAPAGESNCGVVYVTGPAAGVYRERGTQGNRGDFFSNNRVWNLYWAFYAGKPVNANRFRRGLSGPDGVYGQGRDGRRSKESDWALQAFTAGWQGEGLGLDQPQQRKGGGGGEGPGEGAIDRRLEFCEDGFWLITPRGGGFPFYGTQNCANHPADIAQTAVWSVVQCDGCGSEVVTNQTFTVSCNGAGFTPPPSPIDSATRAPVDGVDEAGDEGAAARATPNARLAGTVFWSLLTVVGVAVAAF